MKLLFFTTFSVLLFKKLYTLDYAIYYQILAEATRFESESEIPEGDCLLLPIWYGNFRELREILIDGFRMNSKQHGEQIAILRNSNRPTLLEEQFASLLLLINTKYKSKISKKNICPTLLWEQNKANFMLYKKREKIYKYFVPNYLENKINARSLTKEVIAKYFLIVNKTNFVSYCLKK